MTCTVTGTVKDPLDAPAPEAEVTFQQLHTEITSYLASAILHDPVTAVADGDGAIEIALIPGAYEVRIVYAGGRYRTTSCIVPNADTAVFGAILGARASDLLDYGLLADGVTITADYGSIA